MSGGYPSGSAFSAFNFPVWNQTATGFAYPTTAGVPRCDSLSYFHWAMGSYELTAAQDVLKREGISLHTVLIGDKMLPHTRLLKSLDDENRCMEPGEARKRRISATSVSHPDYNPTVDPLLNIYNLFNSYSQQSPAIYGPGVNPATSPLDGVFPFNNYFAWEMYRAQGANAPQGKGTFMPVRFPCDPSRNSATSSITQTQCEAGDLEDYLDTRCAAASPPAPAAPGQIQSATSVTVRGITDNNARLVCDARCRSKREQIRTYMDDLLSQSPYLLVE